jgi:uncharacterized protein YqjF (DUF2071 family)
MPSIFSETTAGTPSSTARRRMLSVKGEPLFYADWVRAVFIHYEVDAAALQRDVPFELDLRDGSAYVSLVAFTLRNMRPRFGGKLAAFFFKPIATHEFLNVRAYVRHHGETGIYFLAEWLANPLSVRLGPPAFGLPYRLGRFQYHHNHEQGGLHGLVATPDNSARLEYAATIDPAAPFASCDPGSRDEFLMERYTAFTARNSARRLFRIWHPTWPQTAIDISTPDTSLLTQNWAWFKDARLIGANYSPGVSDVSMGRPHRSS